MEKDGGRGGRSKGRGGGQQGLPGVMKRGDRDGLGRGGGLKVGDARADVGEGKGIVPKEVESRTGSRVKHVWFTMVGNLKFCQEKTCGYTCSLVGALSDLC